MATIAIGVGGGGRRRGRGGHRRLLAEQFAAQVGGEEGERRVVEDQRAGQVHPGEVAQAVAELDRAEGVESEALEGLLLIEPLRRAVAEDERGALPDQVHHHALLLRGRQSGQPAGDRIAGAFV
ncbi:hypothetical protein VR46_25810, partial [Streptomyces sp. NRRL S-444]